MAFSHNKRHWLYLTSLLSIILLVSILLQSSVFANDAGDNIALSRDTLATNLLLAQDLVTSHQDVAEHLDGHRAEVFNVHPTAGDCASCVQVNIYDYEANATIVGIADTVAGTVDAVYYQPNTHPHVNDAMHAEATEAVLNSQAVAEALGRAPLEDEMIFMHSSHVDSPNCANNNHICVATVFLVDSGTLWVMYDVNTKAIDKIWWDIVQLDDDSAIFRKEPSAEFLENVPEACDPLGDGSVSQGGWTLDYEMTPSDALQVMNVTYNGDEIATNIKLLEWHAHYPSGFGYEDRTGCNQGGGGGGFPIYPFGPTEVIDILGPAGGSIGFRVVQDFRMNSWPNHCNYRYEQHFEFYNDGRWRVNTAAFGEGCGNDRENEAIYRPLIRIDIALDGDGGDNFDMWDGSVWQAQATEMWDFQDPPYTSEGYLYRVSDDGGMTYYIEPGQGQFGDAGTGDNAYIYATRHRASEGDVDMGIIGDCCVFDHEHGPHLYVDGEDIDSENLVLYYVPSSKTITTWEVDNGLGDVEYCWSETTTDYWPCFAGPMFVPATVPTAVGFDSTTIGSNTTPILVAVTLLIIVAGTGVVVLNQRRS